MVAALDGVTVIDCTEAPAGPFCSKMLAAMGAEAILTSLGYDARG